MRDMPKAPAIPISAAAATSHLKRSSALVVAGALCSACQEQEHARIALIGLSQLLQGGGVALFRQCDETRELVLLPDFERRTARLNLLDDRRGNGRRLLTRLLVPILAGNEERQSTGGRGPGNRPGGSGKTGWAHSGALLWQADDAHRTGGGEENRQ